MRLHLELSTKAYAQLVDAKKRTEAASLSEAATRAISLYDLVTNHVLSGSKLVLQEPNGKETELLLIL